MIHNRDLLTPNTADYALLDTGEGQKLERYGDVVLKRPDPQALWKQSTPALWKTAHLVYKRTSMTGGQWQLAPGSKTIAPERWPITLCGAKVWVKPTASKHVGVFPEQYSNWQWMADVIAKSKRTPTVLNLFGYTGIASIVLAQSGAKVTHVDSSKTAVNWLFENEKLSNLSDKAIRLIVDDAFTFVARELRRGSVYDAIVMDPPAFGRGPGGELWEIERQFLTLVDNTISLLSKNPLFYLINGYAAGYPSIAYRNNVEHLVAAHGGSLTYGELTIAQQEGKERVLPAGIYARWER